MARKLAPILAPRKECSNSQKKNSCHILGNGLQTSANLHSMAKCINSQKKNSCHKLGNGLQTSANLHSMAKCSNSQKKNSCHKLGNGSQTTTNPRTRAYISQTDLLSGTAFLIGLKNVNSPHSNWEGAQRIQLYKIIKFVWYSDYFPTC